MTKIELFNFQETLEKFEKEFTNYMIWKPKWSIDLIPNVVNNEWLIDLGIGTKWSNVFLDVLEL
jgi:hypothetical protein